MMSLVLVVIILILVVVLAIVFIRRQTPGDEAPPEAAPAQEPMME